MTNIRPELDALAKELASGAVASNRELEDAIAKVASEKGLGSEVVRALTSLTNRHTYKRAMSEGKPDETPIANAEAIVHRMRAGDASTKTASHSASASAGSGFMSGGGYSGGQYSGAPKPLEVGPMMTTKLAAEEKGLSTQVKGLNAQVREGKSAMLGLAKLAKQTGLTSTPGFDQLVGEQPETAQALMREAVEKCASTVWPYSVDQLKLYLPKAIEDVKKMASIAGSVHESQIAILDANEKLDTIQRELGVFRGGYKL